MFSSKEPTPPDSMCKRLPQQSQSISDGGDTRNRQARKSLTDSVLVSLCPTSRPDCSFPLVSQLQSTLSGGPGANAEICHLNPLEGVSELIKRRHRSRFKVTRAIVRRGRCPLGQLPAGQLPRLQPTW